MSRENVDVVRAMGSSRLRRVTARRRTMDDRLVVSGPAPLPALVGASWLVVRRISPTSRVRRALLARLCVRTYGAFNRRDLPVFLGVFHPEIVYDMSHVAGWPEKRSYRGIRA